ncbi:50S ribosome-binding GTPase [Fragilaria crotonensis]|nr:50S ribosome-binding GTPase [Fragilaria crotonensis]
MYHSLSFGTRQASETNLATFGFPARHEEGGRGFLTSMENSLLKKGHKLQLPSLQLVLTKCDLVTQEELARRVVQVERQLSDCLRRQTSNLPVLVVSVKPQQRGVIELQKELAALVPKNRN